MNVNFLIHVIIIAFNVKLCQTKNYTNYVLYNLVPVERYQLNFLQNLEKMKYMNVIFWRRPFRMYTDIHVLVSPTDIELFKERLHHFSMKGTVLTDNIQKLFDHQKVTSYTRMKLNTFSWRSYHSLESIYQWMTDIAIQFNTKVNLTAIGNSAEGREILAIEVRNPNAKANVIVEGAIHGNEWVTAEFVTYLIYHIINAERSTNARLKKVAKKFHWIMVPVANPDGYVYSMREDRLWRKNRRDVGNGNIGVDLNKNFNYNFCKHTGSPIASHEYYCGSRAFSEPESLAISNLVEYNKDKLNYYFSFHSYGQKIIIPYSDRIQHLENYNEMENYGKQAILKMYNLYGVKYGVGTIYDVFGYRSSGDSISWVKKNYKVKYALTFLLRDNGTYGYALPSDQILPTCKETLVGLLELMTVRHRHVARELFSSATILKTNCLNVFLFFIIFYHMYYNV